MNNKEFIKFLGTAGARFVVAKQLRSSAGVFIRMKGKNIILDPGPGTLVKCTKSKPRIDVTKLDAIILTHAHIDHTNDVNILIDAMTSGGLEKRGILFAPNGCINGEDAVVLKYLRGFMRDIVILEGNQEHGLDDLRFSTSARHQHPVETYGINFDFHGRKISFMVDTKYFPDLIENYRDAYLLVINVVRYNPHESGKVMHLCVDDVRQILARTKPRKAILTHFGMTMLKARPWELAKKLTEELGLDVTAASDGMTVKLPFPS